MAMQHVIETERQGGGVPVTSIPSTFARAAFPLGGIGTGTVSLGARGELRDWELVNSPAKGRRSANSFFAIHARVEGGVAVNRVLEARLGGDPTRDQAQGFWYGDLGGLPRLASARLIGEFPIARVEFEDPELPVRVALTAFTPLVPLDADASGIPATVLRYSVTNPGDVPASVTIAGSLSHLGGDAKNHHNVFDNWFAGGARQTSAWRDDGDVRGLDFGVDLDPADRQYGTMSLMTRAERVTAKPAWVRSFVGVGAELFWRDFAADGLLDEADKVSEVDEVDGGAVPARTTGSLGIVADLAPGRLGTWSSCSRGASRTARTRGARVPSPPGNRRRSATQQRTRHGPAGRLQR
jgi:non-lysosomal glucosylceramidase